MTTTAITVVSAVCVAAFTPIKSAIGDFVDEHVLGEQPLTLSVDSNTDRFNFNGGPISNSYYFARKIDTLPPPPNGTDDCTGRYTWAHNLGGIDDGGTYAQFSLYSRSKPVTVLGADVRIVGAINLSAGSVVGCRSGGEITVRHLEVDLSKRTIVFDPGNHVMAPLALTIPPGQTEVIQLVARPNGQDCKWVIDLFVQVDGKDETLTVDNHGTPFSTIDDSSGPTWGRNHGSWYNMDAPVK